LIVTCSRGVKLCADKHIIHCTNEDWDLIACPGGMPGAAHLRDSPELKELLMNQNNSGKYIAAICAAPAIVFSSHGLLKGKTATCYPGPKLIAMMENRSNDRVVVDGNVITSQGPGTSLEFSLKLVEILFGVGKATELSKEMLLLV
jgi:4-methyl-5(b-hydroxyethyl)-thiazole monophosphate biosynthesis